MGRMSDLDLTLRGIDEDRRVRASSSPTLTIQVIDDASLIRAVPSMWRGRVNRWLTVEWWCMGPGVWMGEEWAIGKRTAGGYACLTLNPKIETIADDVRWEREDLT